jgi:hypothetical protein
MKVLIFFLVISNIKIHFSQTFAIFAKIVFVLKPSKSINDTQINEMLIKFIIIQILLLPYNFDSIDCQQKYIPPKPMVRSLPLPKSVELVGSESMDQYFARLDSELAQEEEARQKLLNSVKPKFAVRSMPLNPDLPPDIAEYFEKSQKNDESLAAAIQQMEQQKIDKQMAQKKALLEESMIQFKEEITKRPKIRRRSKTRKRLDY